MAGLGPLLPPAATTLYPVTAGTHTRPTAIACCGACHANSTLPLRCLADSSVGAADTTHVTPLPLAVNSSVILGLAATSMHDSLYWWTAGTTSGKIYNNHSSWSLQQPKPADS